MAILYTVNCIMDPKRQRAAWLLLKSARVKHLEIPQILNIVHKADHSSPGLRERCLPRGEHHLGEAEVLQKKLKTHTELLTSAVV